MAAAVGSVSYIIQKEHVFIGQGEVAFSKTYALATASYITCFVFCGHDPLSKWSFVAHIDGSSLDCKNPRKTTDLIRDTILSLGLQLKDFRYTLSGGVIFEKQHPNIQKFFQEGGLTADKLLSWKNTMLDILMLSGFEGVKKSRFLTSTHGKIPGLVLNPLLGKIQFMKKPWEILDDYSEERFNKWYQRHGIQAAFGADIPMTLMIVEGKKAEEEKAPVRNVAEEVD